MVTFFFVKYRINKFVKNRISFVLYDKQILEVMAIVSEKYEDTRRLVGFASDVFARWLANLSCP